MVTDTYRSYRPKFPNQIFRIFFFINGKQPVRTADSTWSSRFQTVSLALHHGPFLFESTNINIDLYLASHADVLRGLSRVPTPRTSAWQERVSNPKNVWAGGYLNQMSHRDVSGVLRNDWNDPVDFRSLDRSQRGCYIWVSLSYRTANIVVSSLYH